MERIFKPGVTMRVLSENNIKPLQRFGQNFLIDGNILENIAAAANLTREDRVLEVGPGLGALTQVLAEKCAQTVAIEIDGRLIKILRELFHEYNNVEILEGDILKVDLKEIMGGTPYRWKVVANLPYYITSPVIMRLLEESKSIDLMVVMVQKEVAQRMVAKPGGKDYGILSVFIQYHCDAHIVHSIPPTAFFPRPDVSSAVVLLKIHRTPPVIVEDEMCFSNVVKAAFGKRRKTLLNALGNSAYLSMERSSILEVLNEVGVEPNARAESLTIQEFANIARIVSKRFAKGSEGEEGGIYKSDKRLHEL